MDDQMLNQVVQAVNVILNPASTPAQRITAHSICESCQENEMCPLIGYTLVSTAGMEPQVKQFGLQLMQHFIRNTWVKTSEESRKQTQNNAMSLLENCPQEEWCFVKDGISHVLTEIAKQVWPQNWPTMVGDLIEKATKGPIQTELVELIFLRLAEDVALLQNISVQHRAKDIRQGLSLSMPDIMQFYLDVLERNASKYVQLLGTTNAHGLKELDLFRNQCCCTLRCLQGFVEWINMEHLFLKDGALVQSLCQLINVEGLQVLAVECLLLVESRKAKPEEQKLLVELTTARYVNVMLAAIQSSVGKESSHEDRYLFLKRMAELFASLTGQILVAMERENASDPPTIRDLSNHTAFLDVMLAFLGHENPVIASTVFPPWINLLKHRVVRTDATLNLYIPRLFEIASKHVQKDPRVVLPQYARIDFNDKDEVDSFLASSRKDSSEMIRCCARCTPVHCMNAALQMLSTEMSTPLDIGVDDRGVKLDCCKNTSPSYIRWDALAGILDLVFATSSRGTEKMVLPIEEAENALSALLSLEIMDILLHQCLLSMISAFLPLVERMSNRKTLVIRILQHEMKLIDWMYGSAQRWSHSVKTLRRHILSSIIHICKYHPGLVTEVVDEFKGMMMQLVDTNCDKLTPSEKVSVFEALVLVSGEWKNFSPQSGLIGEIMTLSNEMWPTDSDARYKTPSDFARAVGLCSSALDYGKSDHSKIRADISYCIQLTLAMINRSKVPEDMDLAKQGGFVDPDGNVLNPCAQHVFPVVKHIVQYVHLMHGLWTNEALATVHEDMASSLGVKESEKRTLMLSNPQITRDVEEGTERSPWQQMQNFVFLNLDNCYQILGAIGRCVPQLYSTPEVISSLLPKVFANLDSLPKFRLRMFIRQFLYYFFKHCPESAYQNITVPVLMKYCPFMNTMLQTSWEQLWFRERARLKVVDNVPNDDDEEDPDEREDEEIFKERLLRMISREYIEMLVNLCVIKTPRSKNGGSKTPGPADENQSTDNDAAMSVSSPTVTPGASLTQLTPLGLTLMESEMAEPLLATSLSAISWHDTMTAFKGVQLIWPLLKHTLTGAATITDEAAGFVFESVLRGLQVNGQHDGCQAQLLALGVYIFVHLRPSHPSLTNTLKSIPNVNLKSLQDFDENYAKYSEKKRKMTYKKLVAGIIDQHISQRFKTRQKMSKLPDLFPRRKKKNAQPDVGSLGLEFFFRP